MIQTVPYAAPETAEIMSRYRPIAPKPEVPGNDDSALTKSPYLRSIWDYLQARPTRTRRRGRSSALLPPYSRRNRADRLHGLVPVPHQFSNSPAIDLAFRGISNFPINRGLSTADLQFAADHSRFGELSLNRVVDLNADRIYEEINFLQPTPAVISPKPIRPVTSRIIITDLRDCEIFQIPVKAQTEAEVEVVLQSEAAPAMVSDSRNRVRLTNSAYNELIGQPECGWLDCCGGGRRIGGEVVMEFRREVGRESAYEFRGKIEWESEGKMKRVNAHGNGVKLGNCRVRDYVFLWTFFLN